MSTLSLFNFKGHAVRVSAEGGDPWFVVADVCRSLGLAANKSNGSYQTHYRKLEEGETRQVDGIDPIHPKRRFTAVSESGLYKLVMRSDKPEARAFQDWVTREVLPSIRKDGSYVLGEEKVRTGEMTEDELVLAAMEAQRRKIDRLVAERDAAKKVIHEELELVTVDEFRALNHQYWEPQVKSHVSQRASKLAKSRGIALEKQARVLVNGPGAGRWVYPNVYPRSLLAEACAELGVSAK